MVSADVARPRRRPPRPAAAAALRLVQLDARRPAAWVSLGAAVLVGRSLAALGELAAELVPAVAIAGGGLLAVAALDAPAGGLPDGRRRPWLTAWLLQAAWPIVGACGAVAMAGGDPGAAAVLAAAAVATAAAGCAAVKAGATFTAGVAASLALAGAAAGAALTIGVVGAAGWPIQAAAAAAAWAVLAAAAWAAPRDEAAWSWSVAASDGHGTTASRKPLVVGIPTPMVPTNPAPTLLVVAALVSSLAAMVFCFFLAPVFEKFYAAVAGGWFLCLAVPPATAGVGGTAGRRLAAAAPGRPAVPGSITRAIAASVWILAALGWPAVVALVLPAADGSRGPGPLLALGVLSGLAVMLLAAVGLAGQRGNLARSLVLAAAAVAAAGLPVLPPLPWQPWLPRFRSVLSHGGDPARLPIRRSRLGFTGADPKPGWMSRIDDVAPDNTFSPSRRS